MAKSPAQRLAELVGHAAKKSTLEDAVSFGEVISFTFGTSSVATTAEVDLDGAGVATMCLSLDQYTYGSPAPAAGDIVMVLTVGQDSVILGRVS